MRKRRRIKASLRNRIITESNKAGCNMAELAKSHNISPGLLYKWRGKYKIGLDELEVGDSNSANNIGERFVEIRVGDVSDCEGSGQGLRLQKISLVYDDLIISIGGKHGHKVLPKILEILAAVEC